MGVKLTTEEFIKKAQQIHNQKYDYQLVDYKNAHTKVKIICPEHGVFEQLPLNHTNKRKGCSKCSNNIKKTTKQFVDECILKFGNIYDYGLVDYSGNKNKVKIICKEHGIFEQSPIKHINGTKCPKCVGGIKKTKEEFIEKAIKIHKGKYDYSEINYSNNIIKIKIKCEHHGIFEQRPNDHMMGKGCPKCKSIISKPEIEVQNFVKSLGFKIQCNNRKILNGKELDIYIPELNKAIEFNGFYWHYDKTNPNCKPSCYHSTKSKLCKSKNINLLHLREDLWNHNKQKMKKVIHKFLNIN